jgi:hypothetical protein
LARAGKRGKKRGKDTSYKVVSNEDTEGEGQEGIDSDSEGCIAVDVE